MIRWVLSDIPSHTGRELNRNRSKDENTTSGTPSMSKIRGHISKLDEQVTQSPMAPTKVTLEHHSQLSPMVIWGFLYDQLKEEEKP